MQVQCPPGKYGGVRGLRTPYCAGHVMKISFAPASTSAQEEDCPGADFICPIGTGTPIPVGNDETYILDTTRRHAYACDKDSALHGLCADKSIGIT